MNYFINPSMQNEIRAAANNQQSNIIANISSSVHSASNSELMIVAQSVDTAVSLGDTIVAVENTPTVTETRVAPQTFYKAYWTGNEEKKCFECKLTAPICTYGGSWDCNSTIPPPDGFIIVGCDEGDEGIGGIYLNTLINPGDSCDDSRGGVGLANFNENEDFDNIAQVAYTDESSMDYASVYSEVSSAQYKDLCDEKINKYPNLGITGRSYVDPNLAVTGSTLESIYAQIPEHGTLCKLYRYLIYT